MLAEEAIQYKVQYRLHFPWFYKTINLSMLCLYPFAHSDIEGAIGCTSQSRYIMLTINNTK